MFLLNVFIKCILVIELFNNNAAKKTIDVHESVGFLGIEGKQLYKRFIRFPRFAVLFDL
jgi:hypothetical protein